MPKTEVKNRVSKNSEDEIQSISNPPSESNSLFDDQKFEKPLNSFDRSNANEVLRIQGGGTLDRDVWDILAQAAEEIEGLYENQCQLINSNTSRERSYANRSNDIQESSAPSFSRCQTFNTCGNGGGGRSFDTSPSNRNTNTISNGTYYDTCPSIREFYESSLRKTGKCGNVRRFVPQKPNDGQTNACRRNITFSSPMTTCRYPENVQTYNISSPENRSSYSQTPLSRNRNNIGFEGREQCVPRKGACGQVLRAYEQSRSPNETYNINEKPQGCNMLSQKSIQNQNQTYDVKDDGFDTNFEDDFSNLPTNRTFSNGTFILNRSEVDNHQLNDSEERYSFHPNPALASTPKRGAQTPPFRNYTDPSMEYSNLSNLTGHQSYSQSTQSSFPKIVRNDAKTSRVQRRVNQTRENPKWASCNNN